MSVSLKLTARDIHVLRFLSLRVRVASRSQITRTWWPAANDRRTAERRLDKLESAGFVRSIRSLVTLPSCIEPVCRWVPGESPPEFGTVAWRLQRRLTSMPRTERVYLSTAKGARRFGGVRSDVLVHPFQLSHDLGVAEMYLALLASRPELAEQWIDEARLAPYRVRQKLPDAVIAAAPTDVPHLVLEYGDSYPKRRLLDFHEDCRERGLPYEVW